ncbi:MAG: hypothetical protein KGR98_09075 [Verrucomicrobia bacterium]|nr:hypothetical protein [Verrucomicrobiota bacterium]MDE3100265.1 hypothetical protein [Verrucomicrobiota bacterium]
MRTKTILAAIAALSAGVFYANAQVYSANVVGYATSTYVAGYNMFETPFNMGVSNGANEIYGANLQDGMTFVTWNGSGFNQVLYSPSLQGAFGQPTPWLDPNSFTSLPVPTLPPGEGYFLYSPAAGTNVPSGVVAVNVGATNTMNLVAGYSMVGSVIPGEGSVTNSIFNVPTQDGETFVTWNGSSYDQVLYSPSLQGAFGDPTPWLDPNTFASVPEPSLTVGEGFFFYQPNPTNWVETLPSN